MTHDIAYYKKIHNAYGATSAKQTSLREIQLEVERGFQETINWETVKVNDRTQELQITRTANRRTKDITTRPNEKLRLGERIVWRNAYWLVVKVDADDQITYLGEMSQCNTALKWQLEDGSIYTEYGVSEDATKYGTGTEDSQYLQIGEFSLKVKIPINEKTLKIQRDKRFLIGQYGDGFKPNAYIVTRINQVTNSYEHETLETDDNGNLYYQGYLEVTLGEDQYRVETDRGDLGIADYVDPEAVDEPGEVPLPPLDEESGWF